MLQSTLINQSKLFSLLRPLAVCVFVHSVAAILKRPRSPPTNNAVDYQTADSEHVLKRSRPFGMSDEVRHNSLSAFLMDLVEV